MLSGLKGEHIWVLAALAFVAGLACLGMFRGGRAHARNIWSFAFGEARDRAIRTAPLLGAWSRRDWRRAPDNSGEDVRRPSVHLQAALRHMSQGLCMFDGQRRLIFCNAQFAAIFALPSRLTQPGVTLREIMDYQVASGSFPGTDPDEFVREMLRIAAENKSSKSLVEFRDGRFIAAAHEPTAEGGWVATFEDVTERLRAEGDLRETRAAMIEAKAEAERAAQQAQAAHQRLQEAFELMPEGVVLFDSQDRLVIWNRRYAELNAEIVDPLVVGMGFEDLLRRGISLGRYPQAEGWEEQWLAMRRALHAMPYSSHEQRLSGERWTRVEERRTGDGGHLGVRIDITELKRREASFKLLFDSNPLPMLVCDQQTLRFLAVNEAAISHYGYSRDEFLSMSTLDIRLPEDWEKVRKVVGKKEGEYGSGETWRHRKKDGALIEVAVHKQALSYEGRASTLLAVIDMTDQRRAQDEIRQTRMFLDAIVENVPASIVVKDARDFSYVLINRAAEEFYGISRGEVIGKNVHEIYPKETADRITASYRMLLAGRPQISDEHEVETPANGLRLVTTKSLPVFDENGSPQYVLTVIDDITERRRAERRVAHLAHHDALTDLPNRAAFAALLTETIQQAAESGGSFAVLSLDLDHFKQVNDVFGHGFGDMLLREVARRLQRVAEPAFLARAGGDEFMLISGFGDQPNTAAALADKLLLALGDEFAIDGRRVRLGLSVGVAVYPADGGDQDLLISNADAALHRAKAEGRLAVRFFEAKMDERARERHALQHDLRLAIERGEFALHYQPQARIDGEVFGFEALIRWRHPRWGMIPPATFIPIAEEHGLITQIGEWVLRQACSEAASWRFPLRIAVNLSPIQFRHGDLPDLVHQILFDTGLAPERLELEITESVLIDDPPRVMAMLRRLKSLGVKMAMDDFGTGYSSLSSLQSFPFDKIKIDRAFISNLESNAQSAAIVRAIIGLGHGLAMPLIAEGVETELQRAILAREGCDEIQGYLIGRPGPIDDYADVTHGIGANRPQRASVG